MRNTFTSISIFFIFCCYSCLDEIQLSPPKGKEEGWAIRGELIAGEPSIINVYINKLFNFNTANLLPVSVKSVDLIDEEGNQLALKIGGLGLFTHTFSSNDPIAVTYGKKYKIRIESQEDLTFESSFEELVPPASQKGQLSIKRSNFELQDANGAIIETPAIQFQISTSTQVEGQERKARLLWEAERTYQFTDSMALPGFISKTCYISVNLDFDNVHILDGNSLSENSVQNFDLSKVPLNFEFSEGYYYTVYQRSINEGAYRYWDQVKQTLNRAGGLFDTPAGRIQSNIKGIEKDALVLGYFTAYTEDTLRLCILPEEVGFPDRRCPIEDIRVCRAPPDPCCDCILAVGSQLEKPFFWKK